MRLWPRRYKIEVQRNALTREFRFYVWRRATVVSSGWGYATATAAAIAGREALGDWVEADRVARAPEGRAK